MGGAEGRRVLSHVGQVAYVLAGHTTALLPCVLPYPLQAKQRDEDAAAAALKAKEVDAKDVQAVGGTRETRGNRVRRPGNTETLGAGGGCWWGRSMRA